APQARKTARDHPNVKDGARPMAAIPLPMLDQISGLGPDHLMYLPAGIGLIAGLVLLLAGGKLLRPAAALLGAGAGAFAGSALLAGILPDSVAGLPEPAAAMTLGGIGGLVAAMVLVRAAMAAA